MTTTEEFLPILSAGRHRNARRGACFMEFASFLAGERWSDHPNCTHATLASVARLVNDLTSDAERSKLGVHISAVVGLNGNNPRLPTLLGVLAATSALPIASAMRQSALATGLVRSEALLQTWSGPEVDRALERIRAAFVEAPGTEAWARDFVRQLWRHSGQPLAINDEALLRTAVIGIADACVPDTDARLALLLEQSIQECELVFARPDAADGVADINIPLRTVLELA